MTLYRLEPRRLRGEQVGLCAVDSLDADPAEAHGTIDSWVRAQSAAGAVIERMPAEGQAVNWPATLTGREDVTRLLVHRSAGTLKPGAYLLVRWTDDRDVRHLIARYVDSEMRWRAGLGRTVAGTPAPSPEPSSPSSHPSVINRALADLVDYVMHLAPDDPRLREVASASHAKEIGRFIPGDEVGREIMVRAAESRGSSLAGSAHDRRAGARLFEVLIEAARRGALGPGTNPCAVCMGLGECLIDESPAGSSSEACAAE